MKDAPPRAQTHNPIKIILKTRPLLISYDYRKRVFVDFSLNSLLVLAIMFLIECGIANKILRRSAISFKHVSLWCLLYDPHRIHTPIIYGCSIKKK